MISDTFTGKGQKSKEINVGGIITLSLSGTWDATVVLERSMTRGGSFNVVETFTANHEAHVHGTGEIFRLRVTKFTSGSVVYFLGKPGQ